MLMISTNFRWKTRFCLEKMNFEDFACKIRILMNCKNILPFTCAEIFAKLNNILKKKFHFENLFHVFLKTCFSRSIVVGFPLACRTQEIAVFFYYLFTRHIYIYITEYTSNSIHNTRTHRQKDTQTDWADITTHLPSFS